MYAPYVGQQGGTTTVTKEYQHVFKRTAANFATGTFGGASVAADGDASLCRSFCVQSMDGALTLYEGDTLAFERFLPGFLLPGPLSYVAATDSFVTANSGCQLESYRYLTLANAAAGQGQEGGGRRVKSDWSLDIGEQVLDIAAAATLTPTLIVLGERTVFWVSSSSGSVRFCKRMGVEPSCCWPYRVVDDVTSLLVASHDNTLTVM